MSINESMNPCSREEQFLHFIPLTGNACKLQFYFVEILEMLQFFGTKKQKVMETQLMKSNL